MKTQKTPNKNKVSTPINLEFRPRGERRWYRTSNRLLRAFSVRGARLLLHLATEEMGSKYEFRIPSDAYENTH